MRLIRRRMPVLALAASMVAVLAGARAARSASGSGSGSGDGPASSASASQPAQTISSGNTPAGSSNGGSPDGAAYGGWHGDTWQPPDAGNGTIRSPGTVIASANAQANPQLANLLGSLLYFYDIQRTGQLPSDNRVWWRNSSLTDDGKQLSGVDLSGGYFDAGDFIKATFPLCWTLQSIAWGGATWGDGYALSRQAKYLDSTLRWGLDWLTKAASSTPDALWVLVGNFGPDGDNYWGGDRNIPSPRPAYQVNTSAPGTDAFAAAASAFAAGAFIYQGHVLPHNSSGNVGGSTASPLGIKNETYAAHLLSQAENMWRLATTTQPRQLYQVPVPQAKNVYASTDYLDELTMGALWLALATGNASYASAASDYFDQMLQQPSNDIAGRLTGPLNWDQKDPATALLFTQAAAYNQGLGLDAGKYQAQLGLYLDEIVNGTLPGTSLTNAEGNSTGLLWFKGDSDGASLNPAANAAWMLDMAAGFGSEPGFGNGVSNRAQAYQTFADKQVAYFLGLNPMNAVYVVGTHPNSPRNPHSAMASGGTDIGDINFSPPETYVLYGGVPGGPAKDNTYYDMRSDWTQSEIALDYNAPFTGLIAARIAQQSYHPITGDDRPATGSAAGDPVYVALAPNTRVQPKWPKSGGLSTGAKIGIGIGVGLGVPIVLALAALGFFLHRRRAKGL